MEIIQYITIMKKKTNLYPLFLVFAMVLTNCGDQDPKGTMDPTPAVPVEVRTTTQTLGNGFLNVSGKIEAINSANLSTRMMGFVDRIYVEVGQKVKKGELLLSINNVDVSAKLAQVNASISEAQAALTNAQKDYERFTSLYNDNSASQKELDDMTTRYNMAKARLKAAEEMKNEVNAQLSYANIRSPFNGVITNKFIKVGDMANPGMPLMEVESPGNYQVMAMVPESEILGIKMHAEVDVNLKSLEKTVKGKVSEISTSAKNTGGQYLVKVLLEESDANILSGMFASLQFATETKETNSTIRIPRDAIISNGQLSGVYTVSESNTALLRWLRLGRTFGNEIEVLSGLSENENYIVRADGKLYNGAKISIQ